MRIKDMFAKDIDREINGVVKVAQEDDAAIRQELEEYVVTRELKRRFGDFFAAYEAALDRPTEKTGVWISGFFGSGKSHFLKMLSYLLENKVVDGKPAIDYFIDPETGESKFGDPFMDAKVRRCVSVPTETILFNIDNKGPSEKDKTAILKVFARVFYEHLGPLTAKTSSSRAWSATSTTRASRRSSARLSSASTAAPGSTSARPTTSTPTTSSRHSPLRAS